MLLTGFVSWLKEVWRTSEIPAVLLNSLPGKSSSNDNLTYLELYSCVALWGKHNTSPKYVDMFVITPVLSVNLARWRLHPVSLACGRASLVDKVEWLSPTIRVWFLCYSCSLQCFQCGSPMSLELQPWRLFYPHISRHPRQGGKMQRKNTGKYRHCYPTLNTLSNPSDVIW